MVYMYLIYGKWKVGSAVARLCESRGISYEIRDDSDWLTSFDAYDAIVPSPGIPSSHSVYKTGKVKSELDFAYEFLPANFTIIAVTGTDGKSTTSWLLYSLLLAEFGEEKVYLSGNFDIPFSETVRLILEKWQKRGYIVVEVSSFMAYSLHSFRPHYSIFTNFKADHLNWHTDLQDYLDSKMRIIERAEKGSVVNAQVTEFAKENNLKIDVPRHSRIFHQSEISRRPQIQDSVEMTGSTGMTGRETLKDYTNGEDIIISWRRKYKLSETQFSGAHNAMNILASTLITNMMKICSKRTKEYLKSITWLSHRLEKIGEKNRVVFVEDSKSTSSQSLEAALWSYTPMIDYKWWIINNKNLLLIVGGSDKGDSFAYLAPKFRDRVKAMACIGTTKDHFIAIAQQEGISYIATDSLQDAVMFLWNNSAKDDILMLSPGCASFGLFRDYFDRANQFRDIVKKLSE